LKKLQWIFLAVNFGRVPSFRQKKRWADFHNSTISCAWRFKSFKSRSEFYIQIQIQHHRALRT
jgi:hypothetical protein